MFQKTRFVWCLNTLCLLLKQPTKKSSVLRTRMTLEDSDKCLQWRLIESFHELKASDIRVKESKEKAGERIKSKWRKKRLTKESGITQHESSLQHHLQQRLSRNTVIFYNEIIAGSYKSFIPVSSCFFICNKSKRKWNGIPSFVKWFF